MRALDSLRVDTSLPASVEQGVERLAAFDNTDPAAALATVRLARAGSTSESTVYTFTDDRGNPCVVVVGLTLFCNAGWPAVVMNWSIGGGDAQNPDRLVAIYANQVVRVSLTADGASVPVAMTNDVAYAEFPAATKEASMTITYTDGSSNTVGTDLASPASG